MRDETVVVVAGGGDIDKRRLQGQTLLRAAPVIAADGGLELARDLDLRVDVVVGDLDSVSPSELAAAEAAGARIVRHPSAKDATDLELAFDEAVELGATRVVLLGSSGGRLDHLLAGLLLLGAGKYAALEVDALLGAASAHLVRRQRELVGEPGELISLFALHGPAEGVTTEGLVYPLRGETLLPGSTRGVSNEFAAARASVTVEAGVLLAVRPGPGR